jgi:hypothetical protein
MPDFQLVLWDVITTPDGSDLHNLRFEIVTGNPQVHVLTSADSADFVPWHSASVTTISSGPFIRNLPPQNAVLKTVVVMPDDRTIHDLDLILNGGDTPGNQTPAQTVRLRVQFKAALPSFRLEGRWS